MANISIKWLKDKLNNKFFPITHTTAVRNDDGDNLELLLSRKQDSLVSGTNIKTINGNTLIGNGDIEIESGGAVTIENVTDTGDVIKSLEPNIFYKFGTVNSLTIPLISGTDLAVYSGKFTIDSQSAAQSFFVVPATVTTAYSCPTITAGNTYEFNILDNVLMMQEI